MLAGTRLELVQEADTSEEGIAEKIVTIGEDPFQLIALPLYLSRQVAWIIGGFALDDSFVQQVSDTIVSDVSILRLQQGQPNEIFASTLIATRQPILLEQLQTEAEYFDNLQRIDFGDEEYTTLLRSLYQDPVFGGEVLAVIQRSCDENNENVLQFRNLLIQFYSLVIVLSLIAVIYLARSITNPLSNLANAVKRIEAGDYAEQVAVRSRDELGELADSVNSMASGLAEKEKVRDLLGKVVSH